MNLLGSSELALSFLIGCTVKATLLLAMTAGVPAMRYATGLPPCDTMYGL